MTRYPQVLVNVKVREKRPLEELPDVQALIHRLEDELGGRGACWCATRAPSPRRA